MKLNSKKLASVLVAVALIASVLPTQKADASVFMAGAGNDMMGDNNGGYQFYNDAAAPVGWIGVAGVAAGFFFPWPGPGVAIGAVGFALVILDTDGSLPCDQISHALRAKFPFLDNTEVVTALAARITSNYEVQKNSLGQALVSVAVEDTQRILLPEDLTGAQVKAVSDFLK